MDLKAFGWMQRPGYHHFEDVTTLWCFRLVPDLERLGTLRANGKLRVRIMIIVTWLVLCAVPLRTCFRLDDSAIPVPWQRGHTGPEGSIVVHRWIGTCSVTEELKAGGTDDVCELFLVSTGMSAVLLVRNAGLPGNV